MRPHQANLADLFEAAGDPAELILAHLALKDLGSLAASCSSLRAIVARQPEAMWQAAACKSCQPSHPARRAADVRACLRLQSRVHANIKRGRYSRTALDTDCGVPAPDLSRSAVLDQEDGEERARVVVRDLHKNEVLQRWPLLPSQPTVWQRDLQWDPSSAYLACSSRHDDASSPTTLIVVGVLTGQISTILPSALGRITDVKWAPLADRPSTLLVCSRRLATRTFSVFTADCSLVDSIPAPCCAAAESATWAPCGSIMALHPKTWHGIEPLKPLTWLWRIGSGAVQPVLMQSQRSWYRQWTLWSPWSDALLLGGQFDQLDFQAINSRTRQALWIDQPMPATHHAHLACWGRDIALVCRPGRQEPGMNLVLLLTLSPSNQVIVTHDLSLALEQLGCASLSLDIAQSSPDGEHLLMGMCPFSGPTWGTSGCKVLIVSLESGKITAIDVPYGASAAQWSSDGSQLLVPPVWPSRTALLIDFK